MAQQRNDLKPPPQEKSQSQAVAQQQPKPSGLTFDQFVQEFDGAGRQREITAMLPENVPFERFRSTAIAAVKQNPEILTATPRSVFNALTKAAQDGLLPDGREGFINVYNTKTTVGDREVWLPTAQWMPMTFGIRKRARELDAMIIDAQVVYMDDHFEWHQGDTPKIVHIPAKLGKAGRGEKVGAYAIFKRENGLILHREVMDYGQIEKVKEQSKAKGGLLWTKFEDEAYRKSAVRRGSKTVPVSDGLRDIIQRGDEDFDFNQEPSTGGDPDIAIPPQPRRSDFERNTTSDTGEAKALTDKKPEPAEKPKGQEKPAAAQPAAHGDPRPEPPAQGEPAPQEVAAETAADADGQEAAVEEVPHTETAFDDWLNDEIKALQNHDTMRKLAASYDPVMQELEGDDERMRKFTAAYEARQEQIKQARKAEK